MIFLLVFLVFLPAAILLAPRPIEDDVSGSTRGSGNWGVFGRTVLVVGVVVLLMLMRDNWGKTPAFGTAWAVLAVAFGWNTLSIWRRRKKWEADTKKVLIR